MTVNRNNQQRSVREASAAREFMDQARSRVDTMERRPPKPIRQYTIPGVNGKFSTRPFRHDTPMLDGLDHINVAHDAVTELGVALNMDFEMAWSHPVLGDFLSLSNFWQYITRPVADDGIRFLKGFNLRRVMKRVREAGEETVNVENFRAILLHAIYERITQSDIFEMFITSELPFENYYAATDKGQPARRQNTASWMIPALEMMRHCMIHDITFPAEQFCDTDRSLDDIYAELLARPRTAAAVRPNQAALARRLSANHKTPKKPSTDYRPVNQGKAPRLSLEQVLAKEVPEKVALFAFPSARMAMDYALSLWTADVPQAIREGKDVVLKPTYGVTIEVGTKPSAELLRDFPVLMTVLKDDSQSLYFRFGSTSTYVESRSLDIVQDTQVHIPENLPRKDEVHYFVERLAVPGLGVDEVFAIPNRKEAASAASAE